MSKYPMSKCRKAAQQPAAARRAEQAEEDVPGSERRRFLAKGGALAGAVATLGLSEHSLAQSGTAAGGEAAALPPHVPPWTKQLGEPTASPYGKPSSFETRAVRHLYPGLIEPMSAYSTTPLQELDGTITPNGLFYERHHAGVPQVDPEQHRLMIH